MPVIPPDTRAAGQTGHIGDHNAIADVLTQFQTQLGGIPNFTFGQATLVAGTVTVNDVNLTANSLILHSRLTVGGTTGTLTVSVTPSVSFTITSTSNTETSVVAYLILN